jgi:hypothetical protein
MGMIFSALSSCSCSQLNVFTNKEYQERHNLTQEEDPDNSIIEGNVLKTNNAL